MSMSYLYRMVHVHLAVLWGFVSLILAFLKSLGSREDLFRKPSSDDHWLQDRQLKTCLVRPPTKPASALRGFTSISPSCGSCKLFLHCPKFEKVPYLTPSALQFQIFPKHYTGPSLTWSGVAWCIVPNHSQIPCRLSTKPTST